MPETIERTNLVIARRVGEVLCVGEDIQIRIVTADRAGVGIAIQAGGTVSRADTMRCGDQVRVAPDVDVTLERVDYSRGAIISVRAPENVRVDRLEVRRMKDANPRPIRRVTLSDQRR